MPKFPTRLDSLSLRRTRDRIQCRAFPPSTCCTFPVPTLTPCIASSLPLLSLPAPLSHPTSHLHHPQPLYTPLSIFMKECRDACARGASLFIAVQPSASARERERERRTFCYLSPCPPSLRPSATTTMPTHNCCCRCRCSQTTAEKSDRGEKTREKWSQPPSS